MNPRSGGAYFEIYAGTSGVILRQNIADGGQPLAVFTSLDRSCDLLEMLMFQICMIKLK